MYEGFEFIMNVNEGGAVEFAPIGDRVDDAWEAVDGYVSVAEHGDGGGVDVAVRDLFGGGVPIQQLARIDIAGKGVSVQPPVLLAGTYTAISLESNGVVVDGVVTSDAPSMLRGVDGPGAVDGTNAEVRAVSVSFGSGAPRQLYIVSNTVTGRCLTLHDIADSAAFWIAAGAGGGNDGRLGAISKTRKRECANKSTVTTNTKVENAIFGGLPGDKKITPEYYDGREIGVSLGKLGTSYLRLIDYNENDPNAAEFAMAESRLNDRQRFWLTQLQSVVYDNPEETHVYGVDILRKAGYKKPLRPEHAATMADAANEIKTLTNISVWLDTTEESRRYKRDGTRVVNRITNRKIVRGEVSLERYEDGTVDFCVDLLPLEGQDATTALPLYEYARSKGELHTEDQKMFEFTGCGTVTVQHRQIMTYIDRQINSKLSHGDTILFETMFEKIGIEPTKDTRYRLKNKIEKMLNYWLKEGYICSWNFKYKGRACVGITVKRKKKSQ